MNATDIDSEASKLECSEPFMARIHAVARSFLKDKKARGILQVFLSIVLLIWLVNRAGLSSIAGVLAGVNWAWYVPAFLLFLLNTILRAYRWYILLNALHDYVPFRQLVYLYFLGFFFNNFIPSGFGGDVVKIISLRQEHGHGTEALSSVIMDRATGLLGSAFVALLALTWNSIQPLLARGATARVSLPPALLYAIALVSLGIPLGFALVRWTNPAKSFVTHLPLVRPLAANSRLQRLAQTVHQYPLLTLLKALLVSLPFTLNLIATQYCIAQAFSVDVSFYLFPLFVPIIAIINLLPISFNGLGMREGIYQFLFVPAGVPAASAIAMSLAFYFLRAATGLIGGLLYAFKGIRGATELKTG